MLINSFLRRLALCWGCVALPLTLLSSVVPPWLVVEVTAGSLVVAFLVISFSSRSWFVHNVADPLNRLEVSVAQWRKERLDQRADLPVKNELGVLGDHLNALANHFENVFARLTVKTRTDLVTGLPSRAQLLLDISLTATPILILVNVDSFKEINDSYGNRRGDVVLKDLAQRLEEHQTAMAFRLYKMPADEFALLFDSPFEESHVSDLVRTLTSRVNETSFTLEGEPINLRVTCGAAMGLPVGRDPDRGAWPQLLAQADMALKKAKATQKPYLVFHESLDIQQVFERNLFWKTAVKQAIKDERIVAHYQPIIDNLNGNIVKYETLARLWGSDGVLHLPAKFLEVARRSRYDGDITKAMVNQAFAAFSDSAFEFSINLSVSDMLSPEIHHFLRSKIDAHPETARRLVVEILESEGIENYREVKKFLVGMKMAGVKVAIDDFGSGYSNFDYLLKLDVDYIKLDSSLIQQIDTEKNARVIVKTIVGFSQELGLKTISEHVHTLEVYQTTKDLGVDFSQGFYLGKPGPLEIEP